MPENDLLTVNCGRCGTPMIVRVQDVKGKRLIDCEACEKARKDS